MKSRSLRFPLLALALLLPSLMTAVQARDIPAGDAGSLAAAVKAAEPGDRIVMREGEWKDAVLEFTGRGTVQAPITLCAATPGKTVLTGASGLRMAGEHLVVQGLWFQNPDPSVGDTVEFRTDSKTLARHCRLTQCAITLEPALASRADKESRWLGLYGSDNRVDRCLLQGKVTKGTTLVVWLGGENLGRHVIEENYFGPREKLGKNGGETIRVGDSKTSMQEARCIVRKNLFEKCDGEAECISNKSCGNLYQDNTFLEVSGTLTLRHGNGCTVENNAFYGNHARGTGGIRIIGEDHVVRGNYLEKLAGDNARCGITFMLGIPDSPENGYFQVKRARVENNTLVDCEHPVLIGMEGDKVSDTPSLAPVDTVLTGNFILAPKAQPVVEVRCDLAGVRWENNIFKGKNAGIAESTPGILWNQEPEIQVLKPLARASVGPQWWK
ncbi:MAG TPA: polysaccharide lyase 6 family protein [Prosthecobacter sp.]